MLRVDAIVEHASPAERRILLERHNTGFWIIGLICALLNLLPPAWIILPVYSGLVYAHFGLEALRRLRQERVIEARSEEHTSELQSLMRISYAVFCLKKKKPITPKYINLTTHKQTTNNNTAH